MDKGAIGVIAGFGIIGILFAVIAIIAKSLLAKWIWGILAVLAIGFTIAMIVDAIVKTSHAVKRYSAKMSQDDSMRQKKTSRKKNVTQKELSRIKPHTSSFDCSSIADYSTHSSSRSVKTHGNPADYYFPGDTVVEGKTLPLLTPVPIDVKKAEKSGIPGLERWNGNGCRIIDETETYVFFNYRCYPDGSGGCNLRQEKNPPNEVVFFGRSKKYGCIFRGHLFQVDLSSRDKEFYVWSRDVETGEERLYSWLANKTYISEQGRRFNQDRVCGMQVDLLNDALLIDVHRHAVDPSMARSELEKKTNIEMDYTVVVKYRENDFHATAYYKELLIAEEFKNIYSIGELS